MPKINQTKNKSLSSAFWIILCLLFNCGISHYAGTETDTGQIIGYIEKSDSTLDFNGAVAYFRSESFITGRNYGLKKSNRSIKFVKSWFDSVNISQDGTFRFDSVEFGKSYIEIKYLNKSAVVQAFTDYTNPIDTIKSVQLRLPGTLIGNFANIDSLGEDALVRIMEIDKVTPIDTSGSFTFYGIPQFAYRLEIIPKIAAYPINGHVKIFVEENKTTHIEITDKAGGGVIINGEITE